MSDIEGGYVWEQFNACKGQLDAQKARASRAEDIGAFWRSRYHSELAGGFVSRGLDLESANRKADAICAAAIKTFLAATDEADMRKALEGGDG